ncbi:MAG: ATP-binding protein [Acidobacteriota bacterium]
MKQENRQIIIATVMMVVFFALYETVKTILFPEMESITSHIATTIVVGLISFFTARHVIQQQAYLLRERENSNQRLRDALDAAERSGNLLSSILASVAEGLIITDRESQVLVINDAARTLLGLGNREAGRLADMSRDPQLNRTFAAVVATGERVEARLEIRLSDGDSSQRRLLHLHAAPLRLCEAQTDGVVGAFIDITKIERLERVRQEFLANVSHELRTPLASITAYVETLLDGALNDTENSLRFLHTIQRNTRRMRDLVDDVAELAAIESGAVKLHPERLPLRSVVSEVFNGLAHRGAQHGIHLRNHIDESHRVTADARRLEQILTNLIDNAIKFNQTGGEVLVLATVSEDGKFETIHVRDTGPGIAPEHLPRIFERFYRVDRARSRDGGGTGLGLAIVKHLARAHGGEAHVSSEVGLGSEFSIRLPSREDAQRNEERVMAISSS